MSAVAIHVPTFQKEYDYYWQNPHEVSFTWLALLYAILTLAVSLYQRSEEPLPLNLVDSMTVWHAFRKRAAQCLVQANYLTPGRYKGEALFLYTICEFYSSQDAQAGVSFLLGITIRLVMRMGYHRDASHYPNLSAWDGEMRRRFWELLCQVDTLISFQVGLPRTIQSWVCDTAMPSNLHDTDFEEASTALPPGRPEHERTACSYTRAKARIMKVFGQITDLAFSREDASYEQIMELDRRLEEAHDLLPSFFQHRPMTQSIADPTDLVMRRYTLELLYQKSRIVLHRRYMAETESQYAHSRTVCLAAARETLHHHADIWNESLPGGQLYSERFFVNSLQNTDFMLSSMILCLELSQDNELGKKSRLDGQERTELLSLLETTHRIFKESRRRSVDTQRAYTVLTIMLRRVKGSHFASSTSPSNGQHVSMSGMSPNQRSLDLLTDFQAKYHFSHRLLGTNSAIWDSIQMAICKQQCSMQLTHRPTLRLMSLETCSTHQLNWIGGCTTAVSQELTLPMDIIYGFQLIQVSLTSLDIRLSCELHESHLQPTIYVV